MQHLKHMHPPALC